MKLLLGTLLLRPYVFAFLAVFLVAAGRDLGWRRTLGFTGWVWLLAWVSEVASTRIGVPFGLYHYTGDTAGRELFVAGVPFMDSVSFTFLAYASFCLARVALAGRPPSPVRLAVAAGLLMMLLDVVIDPLAVRGDRWFLGRIFYYPDGGVYFGVPLSNFAGWWLVGTLGVGGYLALAGVPDGRPGPGVGLYYGVLAFNLAVTAWIGEWVLFAIGLTLHAALAAAVLGVRRARDLASSSAGFAGAAVGGRHRKGGAVPLRGVMGEGSEGAVKASSD
ncbi:MAG TPA: carotenoid biosynthesis protein [Candidatus Binatia bacterium]|nr:carotenoid biosynthesis protein [Candidatus Binatia bacterium]